MNKPPSITPLDAVILIAWSTVSGCLFYGLAYGLPGLAGLLPCEYISPRVGNSVFLLCSGASLRTVVGFAAGCAWAAAQRLVGRRKRNTRA
jgi:hypothetical protein